MAGVVVGVLDRLNTGFACHGRHCIAPGPPQASPLRCPGPEMKRPPRTLI
ncbi:AAA family ATPase [Burkholderia ubonensis]|uniref:AAA family ATPase n=1 Tax=Burkholderia ubonensis TaxID=101571 RepID=A0A1R1J4T2_9BURK|nr:AAA family ATPase [Burkholderia ubonensis]